MRDGVVACPSRGGPPHRIAYVDWGHARAPAVVCLHGLTGSGRDFDELAAALVDAGYRVVCPDLAGRGRSERLSDPERYVLGQYVADMEHVLADLEMGDVAWIGTSLGGLIGMTLAPRPATRLSRLVLNDVGPFIPAAALRRIGDHLGDDPWFEDLYDAESYLRRARVGYGTLTDEQWRRLTARAVRPAEDDGYRLLYDPGLAVRYRRSAPRDVDVWETWDSVTCPVLVLRGADSDFLLPETAREMARRGPAARFIEIDGCGHHPPLMDSAQIDGIIDWLGPPT